MNIKVVSKLIVNDMVYNIGDCVEVTTKWDAIEGKLVHMTHDKIFVRPIGNIPYDIYLENILDVK